MEARLVLLFSFLSLLFATDDPTKITAEPGEDIILPCRVLEKEPVDIVDWSRADLGEKDHVALYRDDQFDPDGQHPLYRNRVDLQDREMKDGNVSLVLKNVTIKDTGMYECRVLHTLNKRRKRAHLDSDPICIFNLNVSASGNKGGLKGDEGNKNKMDGGNNIGLNVGVPLGVLLGLLIGGVLVYKYHKRLCQKRKQPAATEQELQNMNTGYDQQDES